MEFEKLPRPSQNMLINNNSDNNNKPHTKQRRLLNDMHNMQPYNAYQSFKPVRTTTESTPCSETILIALSYLVMLILFPIAVFCCLITVKEYERVVILRLGRLRKRGMFGPGVVFVLPCVDEYHKVDMRTKAFDVEPQEILTKDSVTIAVDAVVYYSIRNPLDSVLQVANVTQSTKLLAQTTLRNVIGTKNLMEMLTAKETLSKTIEQILDDATDAWGVKVERVEMTDLRLPTSMQRAMAAEAEALREAKAKIVAAEGELNSSRALKQASDVMASNPITLQLRYLQTMSTISSEKNSTIVFPFPLEVMPSSTINSKSKS